MRTIYEIKDGFLGDTQDIPIGATAPSGWTFSTPPAAESGKVMRWAGKWAPVPVAEYEAEMERVAEAKLVDKKAQLKALVAEEKNKVRDGGFEVNGVKFDSDQAARTAYRELKDVIRDNPSFVVDNWKASEGVWVTMDKALFDTIEGTGLVHIQNCFSWQRAKEAAIEAATLDTIDTLSTKYE